jgi:hypothetical protein
MAIPDVYCKQLYTKSGMVGGFRGRVNYPIAKESLPLACLISQGFHEEMPTTGAIAITMFSVDVS